ncbi:MAG: glycoside hydrolase family 95 protein [Brevundimonas sp.]|nr:MAG: glycoside hydrolase family 95 protein [Brevundimonas sp.]
MITRRGAMSVSLGAGLAPLAARRAEAEPLNADLKLWYRQPAAAWVEALPVGNGRLAAMVFGGVERERLQLNDDTLWGGGPYDPANPRAREGIPRLRELIEEERWGEARDFATAYAMAKPVRQMSFNSLGDLLLDFEGLVGASDYRRELDLDGAVASVGFNADGVEHRREVFVSAIDQVVAIRLTAGGGGLSFSAGFANPPGATATASVDGRDTLVFAGRNGAQHGVTGALTYETRLKVIPSGGRMTAEGDRIIVSGADSVVLLVAAATSYRSFRDVSGDPAEKTRKAIAEAAGKGWNVLRADHQREHRRLFRKVTFDIGRTAAADRPTDERVATSQTSDDPALASLYYQYGRYLLISSSRPGTQPANLQGVWNETNSPPWGGKYTVNINTEMNYWPAEPTGLAECVEPLVAMVKDLAITGARTAQVMYGARGWVCHHNTDLWRATAPIDGSQYGIWPTGGAWLCKHLWDRWDYHRERAYLESIYPVLRGASLFFLDTLQVEKETGYLISSPSISPENHHPGGTSLCAGPTMDQQIIRDLFDNTLKAAEILDTDFDVRREISGARDRLAPSEIGASGLLKEWREDWDEQAPEPQHRHVSHLYGVYPSDQITIRGTPELAEAAKRTLSKRGDISTGWAIAWRLNLWARLGDGDRAHSILMHLLSPERTYPNLFDAHPPFQIDGNFGGVSGITEMLLQDHSGEVTLLPSLPTAWPAGSITGLRCRGGFGISLAWADGLLVRAELSSDLGEPCTVRFVEKTIDLSLRAGERRQLTPEDFGRSQ